MKRDMSQRIIYRINSKFLKQIQKKIFLKHI
jgi:hypothetical protein